MLNEIQILANKIDIPYQSLIKMFLKEKISDELQLFGVANQAFKRTAGKARSRLP
jgi:adenylate cyclase